MSVTAEAVAERIISGGEITPPEALTLLKDSPREALHEAAHRVTQKCGSGRFDFCAIVNAKSGLCSEDCKWCAQSAHWATGCEEWGWIGTEACLKSAQGAEANGANRFGIVTSGRTLSDQDLQAMVVALKALRRQTRIHLCGSLGLLSEDALRQLKEAGLERYHCNLETAPSHFTSLCTTHTTSEKMATLLAAKRLGLEICCGGILGMGESDEQLVEFAFALKAIAPNSIPVNVLHPIPGTPLATTPKMTAERIVDSVAILRLVNPATPLRFAGGRRGMSDETARRCIYAGISAGIAGPLLTTPGADFDDDRHLAAEAGYAVGAELRPDEA